MDKIEKRLHIKIRGATIKIISIGQEQETKDSSPDDMLLIADGLTDLLPGS